MFVGIVAVDFMLSLFAYFGGSNVGLSHCLTEMPWGNC